jgi:hypothetical protein
MALIKILIYRPGMSKFRTGLVLVLLLPVVVSAGSPAQATNWFGNTGAYGSCGNGNQADGNPLTFYYSDLTFHMETAMEAVRVDQVGPTHVTTSSPSSSLTVYTDVVAFDANYVDYCNQDWATSSTDQGVVGYTTCHAPSPSDKCEQHSVRFNNRVTSDTGTLFHKFLACHETGHALGLQHRTPASGELGCMPTGGSTGEWDYTDHDIAHINAAW